MSEAELRRIATSHAEWTGRFSSMRLFGWKSNLVLMLHRNGAPLRSA
jgi:hypothetical protein